MIDAEFIKIIQKIADEQGKEVFLEQKRFKSLLKDYTCNEYRKETELLFDILEINALNYINEAENLEECKQSIVKRLEDDYNVSPKKSAEMLDVLFLVLRGKVVLQSKDNDRLNSMSAEQWDNTFTDPRDGKVYRTVQIGNQIWMAENLNFDCPGSRCYGNDPKKAEKYGRLYTWDDANKVCPPGWHLPKWEEWIMLFDFVGNGSSYAEEHGRRPGKAGGNFAYKIKANNGWNEGGNGTDEYGFSALPGGLCENGSFGRFGEWGCWWSASKSESFARKAKRLYISHKYPGVYTTEFNTSNLYSVRCVKDLVGV